MAKLGLMYVDNSKDVEYAREMSRKGYCYFTYEKKNGECLITEIIGAECGEWKRTYLALHKKYRGKGIINTFWADTMKDVLDMYEQDMELDDPKVISIKDL